MPQFTLVVIGALGGLAVWRFIEGRGEAALEAERERHVTDVTDGKPPHVACVSLAAHHFPFGRVKTRLRHARRPSNPPTPRNCITRFML